MACNQYHHDCYDVAVKSGDKVIGSAKMHRYPTLKKKNRAFPKAYKFPVVNRQSGFAVVPFVEKWTWRFCLIVTAFLAISIVLMAVGQEETIIYEAQGKAVEKPEMTIDQLKAKTLHDLSIGCEVKGSKEPNAEIIMDSNNELSIGEYMWQIKSIQAYAKLLYGKTLTKHEAILTALGEGEIDLKEITSKVLFEEKASLVKGRWRGGWANWYLCVNKMQLKRDIEIINSLQN